MGHTDRSSTPRQSAERGSNTDGQERVSDGSGWQNSEPIYCRDGRYRRIPLESGLQPLADRGRFGNPRTDRNLSSRIGALQAAGNAIVIPLASEFIRAVMDLGVQ
jgi:hypothetical protein